MDNVTSACDVIVSMMGFKTNGCDSADLCMAELKASREKCKMEYIEKKLEKEKGLRMYREHWTSCETFNNALVQLIKSDFYVGNSDVSLAHHKSIYHIPGNWIKTCSKYINLSQEVKDNCDGHTRPVKCKITDDNTILCRIDPKQLIFKYVPRYYYDGNRDAQQTLDYSVQYAKEKEKENPWFYHTLLVKY